MKGINQLSQKTKSRLYESIKTLKKDYIVIQDSIMPANGEKLTFPGVPAIGSAHPVYPDLYVLTYDVQEGEGKEDVFHIDGFVVPLFPLS